MKKIYKYVLPIHPKFTLRLPVNAQILTMQVQGENPCIWALVQPDAEVEPRTFLIFPTGADIPNHIDPLLYIGTFQINEYVGHLFEASEHEAD